MSSSKIFRCWDHSKKAFAEGPSNKDIEWNTSMSFNYYETHPKTVLQQCTGKKDSRGSWIFEGDIVSFFNDGQVSEYFELRVEFDIEKMCWILSDTNLDRGSWGIEDFMDYYDKETIRVVGNIFEGVPKF